METELLRNNKKIAETLSRLDNAVEKLAYSGIKNERLYIDSISSRNLGLEYYKPILTYATGVQNSFYYKGLQWQSYGISADALNIKTNVLETIDLSVFANWSPSFFNCIGVGNFIYAFATTVSSKIFKINIKTKKVVKLIEMNPSQLPYLAFDGKNIYISDQNTIGALRVLDTTTDTINYINIVGPSYGLCYDGKNIWYVSTGPSIRKLNIETQTVSGVALPAAGFGECVFDGTHVWVSTYASAAIQKIDIETNTIIASIAVTNAFKIIFDGKQIWITHDTNKVSKINITTNAIVETITIASPTQGLAYAGNFVIVTRAGGIDKIFIK